MIVVSDTSPIHALNHLGLLHLLKEQYGRNLVPNAVASELLDPRARLAPLDVRGLDYVDVMPSGSLDRVRALGLRLDSGESEALTLVLEVGAETVLVDEVVGRAAARRLGLSPLGVIGVLVEAKQDGLIESVGPLIDRLKDEIKFFVSDALRVEALRLAGEPEGGPDRE
ncbi:DUF3368 domain-containing protein [Tautonia plasticadhaerens]|uniref:DUF3368 domain-containing protein n=1 Tax=Tautonia plasticadhaerens TaxID=2527974 RepID=A0A518HBX3_9BACT|nr:DUF3368 domain-containing protein [Tautonia plasticadhaerens]QDV38358.1 hypothetical protein ElP_63100 [Tautonia plasticadhaerens]